MDDYIIVNSRNKSKVAGYANRDHGILLITEIDFSRADFKLFRNARIERNYLLAKVDLKRNRSWSLMRPNTYSGDPVGKALSETFDRLNVGSYIFQIHGLFEIGRGFFTPNIKPTSTWFPSQEQIIYFPKISSLEKIFRLELSRSVMDLDTRRETGIKESDIGKIIEYAMSDLATAKVLNHNIQAGVDADIALGM